MYCPKEGIFPFAECVYTLVQCNILVHVGTTHLYTKVSYYINTNEIPGEFSCENTISSHAKITYICIIFTCEKITLVTVT